MSNINQINNDAPQFLSKTKKTDSATPGSKTFHQTFGKVLENMESSKMETAQTEGLTELSSQNFVVSDPSVNLSKQTEELLEKLELYATKLENESISLKDIDSLLKNIQTDAENLLDKVNNSPDADEKIKNIAKEFAVFASTEQLKFQRGDYLA